MAHVAPLREALDPVEGVERGVGHPASAVAEARLQCGARVGGGGEVHAVEGVVAACGELLALRIARRSAAKALRGGVEAAARVEEILDQAELAPRHVGGFDLRDPCIRFKAFFLRRIEDASVLDALLRHHVDFLRRFVARAGHCKRKATEECEEGCFHR